MVKAIERILLVLVVVYASSGYCTSQSEMDSCITVERLTVQGSSMEPMLRSGNKVWLYHSYFSCGNEVERGDIIAFRNAVEKIPLIKRVCATSNDFVDVLPDGYVLINGDSLVNSVGELYRFNEGQSRMIGMYVSKGHIPKDSFLVFGDNTKVSNDSRTFGVCSAKQIIGKFGPQPSE